MTSSASPDWQPQPLAGSLLSDLLLGFRANSPAIQSIAQRIAARTGTRLQDWVELLALPDTDDQAARLEAAGYQPVTEAGRAASVAVAGARRFVHP